MMIAMRPAAAALAMAVMSTHGYSQPQEALDLAGRLYVQSGLAVQMQSLSPQFEQAAAENRGKLPDETIAALTEAGKKAFAEDALREEMVRAIAQKLPAADMRQTLAWLNGPVGRRVTRAEEEAAGKLTNENMQAYFESEKKKPPDPARAELIVSLIEAINAVETGATFIEALSLGVAIGMDAAQPEEKRIGVQNLRARQRALMPPEKLRANMRAALPRLYGFVYRDIGQADLAAYLKFSRSKLGRRYNDAVAAAMTQAMASASVRVGEMLPAAQEKKQV